MKKLFALIPVLTLAAIFAFTGIAHAEDSAAAMIVKVTGTVKVKRGSKEVTVTGKVSLKLGDKVTASGGGSALVLFANGKKVTVTSSLDITEANAAMDAKNTSVAASVVSSSGKGKDFKAKGGGVGGATRAAGVSAYVQIISVPNTNTINTRPVFAWETSAPADSSSLELMNEDGDVLWATKTKDTIAPYPENLPALEQGGEYTLNVKSVVDGDEAEMSTTFVVLDKKQSDEINTASSAIKKEYTEGDDVIIQHMLLAEYYTQKELYMDAVSELNKLVALNEKDIDSHKALYDIYLKTGNKVDAAHEAEIIEKLQKEQGEQLDF